MIDERHLNGTTGESKSYTVTNNGNATSTSRNLYYEQLQEQSDRDYVEVVRCKDCRWQNTPMCWITYRKLLDDYDFCCGGLRREDETD